MPKKTYFDAGDSSVNPTLDKLTRKYLNELNEQLYGELRKAAGGKLKGRNLSIRPTELVNQALLRFLKNEAAWRSNSHFILAVKRALDLELHDYFRKYYPKRVMASVSDLEGVLNLDGHRTQSEMIEALARIDQRLAIVALLKLLGLTNAEVADHLEISTATVRKDWTQAKDLLLNEFKKRGIMVAPDKGPE